MRYILFFFLFTHSLFALSINESLLSIHATLVPKIPLMDYKFQEKVADNSISIIIFYEKQDYRNAKLLEEKIHLKYNKGIKNYLIKTTLKRYNNTKMQKANLYYLLPSSEKNIKHVIKMAAKDSILTFSYSPEDLASGCMISLLIGAKVQPIINLSAVKASKLTFRPTFLRISQIYKNPKSE